MADGGVAPLGIRRDIGQLVGHNGRDRLDGEDGRNDRGNWAGGGMGYGQKYSGHKV
jgi:hypothetical protein